jgi:hypothetical protein
MAITIKQQTEILEVVTGLFNAAPGSFYMTELAHLIEGGMTIEQLADFLTTTPVFINGILAGKTTIEEQVNVLMKNFGLTADNNPLSAGSQAKAYFEQKLVDGEKLGEIVMDAINYLHGVPAPEFSGTAALLTNKVQVAKLYSLNHSFTDLMQLQSVLINVSATSPATEAEVLAYIQHLDHIGKPGSTFFALTFGMDTLTGSTGDDIFTAGLVNNGVATFVNSLESIDNVDGGAGKDTLEATLDGSAVAIAVAPEISNVEVINVRNIISDITIDFAAIAGAVQIWNGASQADRVLTYKNAPLTATFGIKNTSSQTIIHSFMDDVSGTNDNLSLSVMDAGSAGDNANITVSNSTAIETMSIAATGKNFLETSGFNNVKAVIITGNGSLFANLGTNSLNTVDASDNKGGVSLILAGIANDLTVTGGSGNDFIVTGSADDIIDLGAGNDLVSFNNVLTAEDVASGGAGEDILGFADAVDIANIDKTVHTGFETLGFGGASAAVTLNNADLGFTKVLVAGDVTAAGDLTLNNLENGTLEIVKHQTGNNIVVNSIDNDDSFNIVINSQMIGLPAILPILIGLETLPVQIHGLDVTDIENVKIKTITSTDDVNLSSLETDGVISLNFSGASDVIVSDITDADAANNTTTQIDTIDLTNQTGGFEMGANNLGYGTTFILGNLGTTTTATYDFDGDTIPEEASEFFAATGFRDTFIFTTAFEGNIAIANSEFGGNIADDRIDLSALGLSGMDELTFTDVADNVLITSDAFEGQILLVGTLTNEISDSDFIV